MPDDNRLDYLREQRSRPVSVRHQFLLVYKKGSKDLFIFFEGVDDRIFYMPEIRRQVGTTRNVYNFSCDGKKGVLEAFDYVQAQIDNLHRALFFIDKDLDDFIGVPSPESSSVFVTKCYSIENLWVTEEVLRSVWSDFFRLSPQDVRLDWVCEEFHQAHKAFVKIMLPVMAWVIWKQRSGKQVKLNDMIDKLVSIDENLCVRKVQGGYLHIRDACHGDATGQEWRAVRRVRSELRDVEPKRVVRGKYELWFFVKFLNRLEEVLKSKESSGPKPRNRISLIVKDAVNLLGVQYVFGADVLDFLQFNLTRV